MMRRPESPEAFQQRERARIAALPHAKEFTAFVSGPAGAALKRELEEEFVRGKLVGATELETYFNLGARELALWLLSLDTTSERTGDATR